MADFVLPIGWAWKSASEFIEVINGVNYQPEDITNKGIRIVRGGNIQNGFVCLRDDDVFLPIKYADSKNEIKKGDIVIVASTGSVEALGRVAICQEDMKNVHIGAFLRILRPKNMEYADFIAAWLSSPHFYKYIRTVAKGTSINNISKAHFDRFLIPVPNDISEISDTFNLINKKIALNRRENATLEAMAKQLYDYWFVQFDFPDANGRPYKTSGGKMVWNETLKREIPEGWEVKNLNDLTEDNQDSINPSDTPDTVYKHFSIPAYDSCGSYEEEKGSTILSNKNIVTSKDILVSKLNPWTSRVVWGIDGDNVICSTEFVSLAPKDIAEKGFIYNLAKTEPFIAYSTKASTGTSHSHRRVNPEIMKLYPFPYDEKVCRKYSELTSKYAERLMKNMEEIKSMEKMQAFLLPLLMSGQVKINA